MALITCPECNHEVSDKADVCPNCSYPLKSPSPDAAPAAVRNPYRSGAIMGLIGSIAFIVILGIGYMNAMNAGVESSGREVPVWELAAGICIFANTAVFAAGLTMAKSAGRKVLLGISAVALVFAFIGTVGMVLYMNVMALCLGPLFLWEPILQLVGAAKMMNASLKIDE